MFKLAFKSYELSLLIILLLSLYSAMNKGIALNYNSINDIIIFLFILKIIDIFITIIERK